MWHARGYKISMGKPKEKRPLRRLRHNRKDNIKIDLTERGWSGMDWIYVAQDTNQSRTR
jgi:hypothetical protein